MKPILDPPAVSIDRPLEAWIQCGGRILRTHRGQDSGCVCVIAEMDGRRVFFKQARTARAARGLARTLRIYARVRHPVLPGLWGCWQAADGPLLVFEWIPGEPLYEPIHFPGEAGRNHPRSAHARFRALPWHERMAAVDAVLDLHVALAKRGFVSCDFYDGSILYDFAERRTWVVDTDEYREGPFRVSAARLPGSTRFMAPEEFRKGARVDERTTVLHMGRAALVLLGDGSGRLESWTGHAEPLSVLERAVDPDRRRRFERVEAFAAAWKRSANRVE